jgi:hypothetical protein
MFYVPIAHSSVCCTEWMQVMALAEKETSQLKSEVSALKSKLDEG